MENPIVENWSGGATIAKGDVRAAVKSEPVWEATARRTEHPACCEGAETMRLALANMAVLTDVSSMSGVVVAHSMPVMMMPGAE
jgi:hypothetical protein